MSTNIIRTNRLILREWKPEDLAPFAKLNADPKVRAYFAKTKNYEETAEEYLQIVEGFNKYNWRFWAASLIETGEFIGLIGLKDVDPIYSFAPAVEIGWRLAYEFWGQGYATEGALAALKYGFKVLNLNEIISYTSSLNMPSRNVMEKIGMQRSVEEDFYHPMLEINHPLSKSVLYRITHKEWSILNNKTSDLTPIL
jgi:3-dehydroquinate dehydratase/shikimate dehydrogenase